MPLPSANFLKLTFSNNSFENIIRVSNSLDPDQARHFVGPGLGSICLQKLSAEGTSIHLTSQTLSDVGATN